MDEHPIEHPTVKMEPYDPVQQRLATTTFTRRQQHLQPQLQDAGTRLVPGGDHNFGMGMIDMMSSSPSSSDPSQSFDSGFTQLKQGVDYSKSYLSICMTPSEPNSSSDGSSASWAVSNQSQSEFSADGAGSQDSEDGSQQQMMVTAEFGSVSPLRQHGGNSYGGGEGAESPLTELSISQHPDAPFSISESSPTLSAATTAAIVSSSSPQSLSSPMTEIVESPEEIAFRRAEQNRAAQRAFRQRKQKYIKWLESKAEELDEVYRILALVRTENQQLCNIVMELDVEWTMD
ncbi:hypothetical protein EC991_000325 [Linnemannia zychae]|nr:hypothetical protein EC991_000325 [Linnemannia zychae]